jgi:hypothetical protein
MVLIVDKNAIAMHFVGVKRAFVAVAVAGDTSAVAVHFAVLEIAFVNTACSEDFETPALRRSLVADLSPVFIIAFPLSNQTCLHGLGLVVVQPL